MEILEQSWGLINRFVFMSEKFEDLEFTREEPEFQSLEPKKILILTNQLFDISSRLYEIDVIIMSAWKPILIDPISKRLKYNFVGPKFTY